MNKHFRNGQWVAIEHLMDWLNEQESTELKKTDVYRWAMEYRPKMRDFQGYLAAFLLGFLFLAASLFVSFCFK